MGRLLEEYLANNVPALQDIVGGGQQQPEGATTFPHPQEPAIQGQSIGPGGGPMEQAAPAFPPPPGGQIDPSAVAGAPSFGDNGGSSGPPEATFGQAQAQEQPDRSIEFDSDNEDSFAGMAKGADPEQVNKAVGALAEALEAKGTTIDEEYAKTTGGEVEESEDDPEGKKANKGGEDKKGKLTRQEKGLILMEFGLSLMASSGSGEGTLGGDIGKAGAAALGGHMNRKTAQAERLREAEDRKQQQRLTEAKITKAEQKDTIVKADANGNYIIVDQQSGESKPVLMDGKPVQESNREKFASEVDRLAYEDLECEGLEGGALKSCKRRALAYGKGGGAKIAFPELERADQTDRVMKNLEDPDKKSAKYHVPSIGTTKRWREMTPDEQIEVAEAFVNRRMEIITRGNVTTGDKKQAPKAGSDIMDSLSPEDVARLKPGKVYTLSDGRKFKMVDGVPQIVEK